MKLLLKIQVLLVNLATFYCTIFIVWKQKVAKFTSKTCNQSSGFMHPLTYNYRHFLSIKNAWEIKGNEKLSFLQTIYLPCSPKITTFYNVYKVENVNIGGVSGQKLDNVVCERPLNDKPMMRKKPQTYSFKSNMTYVKLILFF